MKFAMDIESYQPCFYIACMHFAFKCRDRNCYHNQNVLSSRIVIFQNSHNCSGLILGHFKQNKFPHHFIKSEEVW